MAGGSSADNPPAGISSGPFVGLSFTGISLRYTIGAWRSLVAHLLWEQGVGGSNPLAPTSSIPHLFYPTGPIAAG